MNHITNSVIPSRMACSRRKMGYSQHELARKIAQYLKRDNFPAASVSLWETGTRKVPTKYVSVLSAILDVSVNYLLGLSDSETGEYDTEITNVDDEFHKYEIPYRSLYKYHNKPVFVEFLNKAHADAWGIFDNDKNRIIFINVILNISASNSDNFKFYTMQPYETESFSIFRKPLEMNKVLERDNFFIRMNTSDPYICGKYNGWYHHNEDRTAMINALGLVLPYEGIGINYFAYSAGERVPVLKKMHASSESDIISRNVEKK